MKRWLIYIGLTFMLVQLSAQDFVVTAPYATSSSTCGQGNDCGLRASTDHQYLITIPNDGTWVFSLCGSTYDTFLFLGNNLCTGNIDANDDDCGLDSEITVTLTAGNYHLTIEGFSGCGNYELDIYEQTPPPPLCMNRDAYAYVPYPAGAGSVNLTDDIHSGVINIGFDFCFLGNTYNQCVISSNNYLSFNTALANNFSDWDTENVPNNAADDAHNAILGPWQDINPGVGGDIFFSTQGLAPNRVFVVTYEDIPMFSCTSQSYSSQIVLMEGSNCIQTLIEQKPICTTWNDGEAVYGVQNSNGSSALVAPGRNNTAWNANSEGTIWKPTCGSCYTSTSDLCLVILLPIALNHFDGIRSNEGNLLTWETPQEDGSLQFVIERSEDLLDFEEVAEIEASGFAEQASSYSFLDSDVGAKTLYYRLRLESLNNDTEYSKTIAINGEVANEILLYPNPLQDHFTLTLPRVSDDDFLEIVSVNGSLVLRQVNLSQSTRVNTSGLPKGIYLVKIYGQGRIHQQKIVLE